MVWWEILLLVIVCVGFAVALGAVVYNKIKGKSGCDGCGSCSSCAGCGKAKTGSKPQGEKGCCDGCAHCSMRSEGNGEDKI